MQGQRGGKQTVKLYFLNALMQKTVSHGNEQGTYSVSMCSVIVFTHYK
jgi:hypothetical protein